MIVRPAGAHAPPVLVYFDASLSSTRLKDILPFAWLTPGGVPCLTQDPERSSWC